MSVDRDLSKMEHRVIRVDSKEYKSMMVTPETLFLIDEKVSDTAEFCAIFEKNATFTKSAEIRRETVDSFSLRKDNVIFEIRYNFETRGWGPDSLCIPDSKDLEDFILYIRKAWKFNHSHKTMTPDEAKMPYKELLLALLVGTGYSIYLLWFGGETDKYSVLFFYKVGVKIGTIGLLLLAAIVSFFIIRKIRITHKEPPYQTWLKRPGLVEEKKTVE